MRSQPRKIKRVGDAGRADRWSGDGARRPTIDSPRQATHGVGPEEGARLGRAFGARGLPPRRGRQAGVPIADRQVAASRGAGGGDGAAAPATPSSQRHPAMRAQETPRRLHRRTIGAGSGAGCGCARRRRGSRRGRGRRRHQRHGDQRGARRGAEQANAHSARRQGWPWHPFIRRSVKWAKPRTHYLRHAPCRSTTERALKLSAVRRRPGRRRRGAPANPGRRPCRRRGRRTGP